jgi:hypothetical protein
VPPDAPTATDGLRPALVAFREEHPAGLYSARRMINPLLDLWAAVAAVDPTLGRPIEALLVTLVGRNAISAEELSVCARRVESLLAATGPEGPSALRGGRDGASA